MSSRAIPGVTSAQCPEDPEIEPVLGAVHLLSFCLGDGIDWDEPH